MGVKLLMKKPGKDFEIVDVGEDQQCPYQDCVYGYYLNQFIPDRIDGEGIEYSRIFDNVWMALGEYSTLYPERGKNMTLDSYAGNTYVGQLTLCGTLIWGFKTTDDYDYILKEMDEETTNQIINFYKDRAFIW